MGDGGKPPVMKPCPFCGGEAEVIREGTNRASCIVGCSACGCRLESNEIGHGYYWNDRTLTPNQIHYTCTAPCNHGPCFCQTVIPKEGTVAQYICLKNGIMDATWSRV